MQTNKLSDWLPTTNKEVKIRGWQELYVILFSGDAYVDHPSFGPAVIGRILESYGLKVAIVPQPIVNDDMQDFTKLGTPKSKKEKNSWKSIKPNDVKDTFDDAIPSSHSLQKTKHKSRNKRR